MARLSTLAAIVLLGLLCCAEASGRDLLKKPTTTAAPKCALTGCTTCPDGKKCTACTGAAFVLKKPASSGQCVCGAGYGSSINGTDFPEAAANKYPTAAPNCGNTAVAFKLPKGPCTCFECPTIAGVATAQPVVSSSIPSAVCNPLPVDCKGSWVATGPCGSTCAASTQPTVFVVTRAARFGGKACEAANGTVGTQACAATVTCDAQCETCGATCTPVTNGTSCTSVADGAGTCSAGKCNDVCPSTCAAVANDCSYNACVGDVCTPTVNDTLVDQPNSCTNTTAGDGTCNSAGECLLP